MYESQNNWCFVPGYKNISVSAPNKKFLTVSQDHSRKLKWFKAARRDVSKIKSPSSVARIILISKQVIPGTHEHVKEGVDECMDR
ncbi:hypothetical protein NQ314_018384 [Rhamnusium bicolor]|uniref:Uncharacterized protein n=1 Tax=Rhamnusium bicolor TaxID=1586634 RepID=A0AAV8WR31_9CUCU|nr:hypothetical protein NQ314_018384 [Rhamnusium bicolor]